MVIVGQQIMRRHFPKLTRWTHRYLPRAPLLREESALAARGALPWTNRTRFSQPPAHTVGAGTGGNWAYYNGSRRGKVTRTLKLKDKTAEGAKLDQ